MPEPVLPSDLRKLWSRLRLVDRRRLFPLRKKFLTALGSGNGQEAASLRETFLQALVKAEARSLIPHAEAIRCEEVPELPITAKLPEIRAAMREHQVVIVCGATGSGKTTQIPKAALMEGFGRRGRIGCTQPRRIAASALAQRLADETHVVCSHEIGYQVRFDDHTGEDTVVKFMTDGILLAETRTDPNLYQYDCLILDEVHERSLNIDFLLGYVKLLLKRRKDIRIVISSATLESARLSAFFDNAPVIEAEGRLFPVEDCFLPPEEEEELPENVARAVDFLGTLDAEGDILVFLPGEREIRDCSDMLAGRRLPHTEILPLFGRLSASDQARIFHRSRDRRIVLSTNVAETSLTIPGIRFVIDSGLVRLSRYNPRSRIQELRVETVSKASAKQRRGRCGRLRDGVCVHLYSEEALEEAPDFTDPEIQRSSLAGVILQMALLRLPKIDVFPFVDPPSPALIREGLATLDDLGALNKDGTLTETGRRLAAMPADPHLAAMLLAGEQRGVLPQTAVIAAFLSIADPRERPFEKAKEADLAHRKYLSDTSDFLSILHLWCALRDEAGDSVSSLRKFTRANYLNFRRVREWRNLAADLIGFFEKEQVPLFSAVKTPYDELHKALMCGLPRRLAMLTENGDYTDMNGKHFLIFPGSGLAKRKKPPAWLLTFALVETSRVFARNAAEVQSLWLEEAAPHVCRKLYDRAAWDEAAGFVYARERVAAGQLIIHPGRRCHYGRVDPVHARELFIREGLAPGNLRITGTWAASYVQKIRELRELETRRRRPASVVDEKALQNHFEAVLPPDICSVRDLIQDWKRTHRSYAPEDSVYLLCDEKDLHRKDFPDSIESAGIRVAVTYVCEPGEKEDGLTYHVSENCLNLVSRHLADYPVPGYMEWKLDFTLRSLPKAYRKTLLPLQDAVDAFLEKYRAGRVFQDQPYCRAVCDFLKDYADLDVPEDLVANIEYPPYLKIRIAVEGPDGATLRTIDEIPSGGPERTTVSKNLPGARDFSRSGCRTWPEGLSLPDSVQVFPHQEKTAWPALTDEGNAVGCALFLDPDEAERSHRRGLVRLIRLRVPSLITRCRSRCKADANMKTLWAGGYPSWQDDLIDYSLLSALDDPPRAIRSAEAFERNLESVRDHADPLTAGNLEFLTGVSALLASVENRLEDFRGDSALRMDVEAQLDYLFRDGFFRTPRAAAEYPRYLKALGVRLERAKTSPGKDASKGEFLEEYIRKFHAADRGGKDPETSPALLEFFLLLEEARISAWSPELPVKSKISPAILRTAWDELKGRF